jgi:hypothetical protein
MSTVMSLGTPTTSGSYAKPDAMLDLEPDKQWKANLRARIKDGLQSMVMAAKGNLNEAELRELL